MDRNEVQEAIRRDKAEDAREVSGSGGEAAEPLPDPQGVWAYPDAFSVDPGGKLSLHISSSAPFAGIRVYKLTDWGFERGWAGPPLLEIPPVAVPYLIGPQNAKPPLPATGIEDWEWPKTLDVPIESAWRTGIYVADVRAYDAEKNQLPAGEYMPSWVEFVIRNRSENPAARILYKLNLNTVQAYNLGMQDGYTGIPEFNNDLYNNPKRSLPEPEPPGYKITLRRPVWSVAWANKSVAYDYPMIKWLEAQEYDADYCTDVDLDRDPGLLSKYRLLLSVGHDEYWSEAMRANASAHRDGGGNIAFLSGNTVCWRVHPTNLREGVPTAFVCDKGDRLCDTAGPDAWWKLGQADNKLVGVGTRNCAIRLDEPSGPFGDTNPASPGFRVQDAGHWVYAGTELKPGNVIGFKNWRGCRDEWLIENLVGYEGGGARIEYDRDGTARPTYTDGTPADFTVLAVAETMPYESACNRSSVPSLWWAFSREGGTDGLYAATMGIYIQNGTVFSASTIHWVNVLNEWDTDGGYWRGVPKLWCTTGEPAKDRQGHPILGNAYLHRITRNVIDRLTQ